MSQALPGPCFGCHGAIAEGQYVVAMNRNYHPNCFACQDCRKSLLNAPHAEGAGGSIICTDCAVAAIKRAHPNAKVNVVPAGSAPSSGSAQPASSSQPAHSAPAPAPQHPHSGKYGAAAASPWAAPAPAPSQPRAAPTHTPSYHAPGASAPAPPVRIPSSTQVAEEHVVSPHAAFSSGGGGGGGGNTEKGFCPKCGFRVGLKAKSCSSCGTACNQ